jgi:4-diphosphocytidyl-2-C-methyl-D-erythritol kinase
MLNEMFSLKLSQQQMLDFASHIGSDCPFFIENRPSFVTGTGNILRSIDLSLSNYCIAVVKPPFFLSTAEMYRQITPKAPQHVLTETVKQPISEWKHLIFNDFEQYAFEKYPEIEQIKTTLYHHGALYASMSGSGSALFGIFEQPPIFHFPRDYQIFII